MVPGPWHCGSSWVAPNHAFHRDTAERSVCGVLALFALDLTYRWTGLGRKLAVCSLRGLTPARQAMGGCGWWMQGQESTALFQEQWEPWKAF